ncbi:hypothetical protein NtRootA1_14340 [Arthrobacter sp. NtRootA1]|nr:hypothetical protein NtRootA1_14340 [Arthrobacter sp. NtRootA1]
MGERGQLHRSSAGVAPGIPAMVTARTRVDMESFIMGMHQGFLLAPCRAIPGLSYVDNIRVRAVKRVVPL